MCDDPSPINSIAGMCSTTLDERERFLDPGTPAFGFGGATKTELAVSLSVVGCLIDYVHGFNPIEPFDLHTKFYKDWISEYGSKNVVTCSVLTLRSIFEKEWVDSV